MKDRIDKPLSERELDRLEALLDSFGDEAMTLEMVDGFFAALICGPERVPPHEWLMAVLGGAVPIESDKDAEKTLQLLIRHWNTIADELEVTLDEDAVYLPVLSLDEEDGVAHANEWAEGFVAGVEMRRESWSELFDDDEHMGSLLPVLMLYHEDDPDPELRTDPEAFEDRDTIIQEMIAGLTLIYRYFDARRKERALQDAPAPMRRTSEKVGRNEPCPCGSGRKYKHCCGANGSVPH
ncbi:yecA family protein [Caballeronia novacaledonica]|uniref:YecA family protein n=1 Tax=Caballeronia novacaledonica TaxID=1544861 RepID=A0A2U3I5T9_9BURK|nr:UPF0149 family protein [Caballeronia novacaledonica]SPB15526.1 yecA family protein [Caballeronia novacaledonica]